jgi:pimeloyl-ACP methyl ester carboxylesterase
VTGTVLATTEYGGADGPPIVALHGGGGPGGWERLVTESAPRRRWICPHLRGFGASVKSPPWTLEQLAQDIVETLDSLRVESVDLLGPSLGGTVAFAVVRLVPARVRSVVVLDCSVCTREEHFNRFGDLHEMPAPRAARLRSARENLPPKLGTFAGHLLLLESGLTHAVTESGKAALREELGTRLRVVTFPDTGHNLLRDAFDDAASLIGQFLGQVDQERPTSVETLSELSGLPAPRSSLSVPRGDA